MSNYSEDRQYNQLLNEYNRLKANYETLSDSYEQKKEQWHRKEGYFKNLVDHARILCEEILAKDKREMKLGSEYTWSKVDTVDLLDKAYYSLKEYNESRTDMMCKIADLLEERTNEIEALQEEIIHLKQNQLVGNLTNEEIEDIAKQETEHKKKTYDADSNSSNKNGVEYAQEEDNDYDETDDSNINEVANINESYNSEKDFKTNSGHLFSRSNKRMEQKIKAKRDAIMTNTVGIDEVMNQIKDTGWEILRVIGEFGICERARITEKILREARIETSESKLNITYKSLYNLGLITNDNIKLSLHPNMCIHDLTANGSKIYTVKFSKNPVLSERVKIVKEHDNEAHGYGIKELLDVLKAKNIYRDLTMETRKRAIKLVNNEQYIPDIMGTYNKMPVYYEFERGTHTPGDFEKKLDKTIMVTKIVNIVVPNVDIAETKILPKIDRYLEKKNKNVLKNVIIRVATIKYINNPQLKLIDNCDWQYVYDLNKGTAVKRNTME